MVGIRLGFCCCWLWAIFPTPGDAAPPEMTRLLPAGGRAGETLAVAVSGKFADWPVSIGCNSTAVHWTALEESGKLRATIDRDARSELCWVRLFHSNGASEAKAFLIVGYDDLNPQAVEVDEIEANDGIAHAQPLEAMPCVVNAVLEKAKDTDTFAVDLKRGSPLVASVEANRRLHSPVDTTLQVLDRRGFVLAQNLDFFELDPCLLFNPVRDDRYLIRVFGFPATPDSKIEFGGRANWVYRLSLNHNTAIMQLPVLPDDNASGSHPIPSLDTGQPYAITLPGSYSGLLKIPKDRQSLVFSATAGSHWRIRVEGRRFGSAIDPVFTIEDASGKELGRHDDAGDDRDPQLDWKCPADGDYRMVIRDLHDQGGDRFFYRATFQALQPDVVLTVASDLIQGKPDKEIDVAVAIQRLLGCASELKIQIEGLPPGCSCPVEVSRADDESAKKVILKINAPQPFQGPIRIFASHPSLGANPREAVAPTSIPLWLSIAVDAKPSK